MSASPPCSRAGAKLLAGFTDVPVNGIPTKWISTNVSPIINPAIVLCSFFFVTVNIIITKKNVKTVSIIKAIGIETLVSFGSIPPYALAPRVLKLPRHSAKTNDPANAPSICEIMYARQSFLSILLSIKVAIVTAGLI